MIIIGLGSGRSGTASLANLVGSQPGAVCFHEMNPSCVRFADTPRPILNSIEEFSAILAGGDPSALTVDLSRSVCVELYDDLRKRKSVKFIGDVAFYYLSYVETIAEHFDNVRFLCLKRDKSDTVESWIRRTKLDYWPSKKFAMRLATLITREPFYTETNHWIEHDGSKWQPDPIYDKCFPKYETNNKREAIERYWQDYYGKAEALAQKMPNIFRIIATENLLDINVQKNILKFCGMSPSNHIYVEAHIHKSN